ncbi:MAG: BLUF domain-containing protein [Gammaproteobacteria bacterium]
MPIDFNLMHLIYVSKAIDDLSQQELSSILSSSQKNNYRLNLTGILIFSNGKFMQFLEGTKFSVLRTFESIKNDFRHHDIDVVRRSNISKRQFEGWCMRLTNTHEISENSGLIFEKLFSVEEMTEDINKLAVESNAWLLAFKHANEVTIQN